MGKTTQYFEPVLSIRFIYRVLDCLTTLGTHLQQIYILEATLQYTLREYSKIQGQMKFEPPDSPTKAKLESASTQMLSSIRNIKKEAKVLGTLLRKVSFFASYTYLLATTQSVW